MNESRARLHSARGRDDTASRRCGGPPGKRAGSHATARGGRHGGRGAWGLGTAGAARARCRAGPFIDGAAGGLGSGRCSPRAAAEAGSRGGDPGPGPGDGVPEAASLEPTASYSDADVEHFLTRTHFGVRPHEKATVLQMGLPAYVDAMLVLPAIGSTAWAGGRHADS